MKLRFHFHVKPGDFRAFRARGYQFGIRDRQQIWCFEPRALHLDLTNPGVRLIAGRQPTERPSSDIIQSDAMDCIAIAAHVRATRPEIEIVHMSGNALHPKCSCRGPGQRAPLDLQQESHNAQWSFPYGRYHAEALSQL